MCCLSRLCKPSRLPRLRILPLLGNITMLCLETCSSGRKGVLLVSRRMSRSKSGCTCLKKSNKQLRVNVAHYRRSFQKMWPQSIGSSNCTSSNPKSSAGSSNLTLTCTSFPSRNKNKTKQLHFRLRVSSLARVVNTRSNRPGTPSCCASPPPHVRFGAILHPSHRGVRCDCRFCCRWSNILHRTFNRLCHWRTCSMRKNASRDIKVHRSLPQRFSSRVLALQRLDRHHKSRLS